MLELGKEEAAAHVDILRFALSLELDMIGITGPRFTKAAEALSEDSILVAKDSFSLGEMVFPLLQENDIILLKGSRGIAMEKSIAAMEQI